MLNLKRGDSVALIVLSNGLSEVRKNQMNALKQLLETWGLNVIVSPYIYRQETLYAASDGERAKILMDFYQEDKIKAIFDVSGGDLSNGILPYLDFEIIKNNPKSFFGYSDLSVILNALYTKIEQKNYLYQIRNLVDDYATQQQTHFYETFFEKKQKLFPQKFEWHQGNCLEGIVVGGNMRCLLKLAGTPYFPNMEGKILLLEGLSGGVGKMSTYLNQLKQMGVFNQISGIILGTFTEMEEKNEKPEIVSLVTSIVDNKKLPLAITKEIGHGKNSKAIRIGERLKIKGDNNGE